MARHKRRKHSARPAHNVERRDRDARHGDSDDGKGERLQKVLAAAGVGSRRDCEELIREGRVEIDRQVVTELGTRVDPLRQEIRVDGEALRQPQRLYYAVNKPIGVVTTNFDPSGRPRVIDLVPTEERVFAVGRLDLASEGLILVTNDGDFANRITHPRYGVEKTYLVRVAGQPTPADLARLKKGVYLSDGFCRVQSIVAKKRQGKSTDLVMVLDEGRNRELRRVLARVGHKVLRLKRIAVGPIKLAELPDGAWRRLMPGEIESLLRLAKEKRKAAKAKRKPVRPPGSVKPVHGQRDESPYLQQQALMAEPLSLEDLLGDDLDEGGNLAEEPGSAGNASGAVGNALRGVPELPDDGDLRFSDDAPIKRGSVIGEGESADRPRPFQRREKKPFRKPSGQARETEQRDERPREGFGKKRSGKRPFTRPGATRDPAGKTAGKFRFRSTENSRDDTPRDARGEGRAERPGGKRFAKPAGGTSGRPAGKKFGGKKFAKPGGKPFGKSSEKPGGKKFGKPGGKRKGRR
jgi:23S rRNA pseudouridine2605 synthase